MSSSSSKPKWIYDVFINFRGEDTRRNFVSHLHAALSNAGINTFLDDEKLIKGSQLGPELMRAIEGSQIFIVVLSQNYIKSSWCLDELVKIMECHRNYGQVVLPVFHYVDPSDVRYQKGAFGQTLLSTGKKRHPGDGTIYLVSRWRTALTQLANLTGWDTSNFRNEAELVEKILQDVSIKLDISFLSITGFPVGLESRVRQVTGFIQNQNQSSKEVCNCIVGIWGMGGSGKTTLAKAIYNQIHRQFMDRSFIENIREVCENDCKGLIHLQQQLLSDVLKTQVKKLHSIALGTTMIEKKLYGKRALVILDDVTMLEQLNALCGNRKWFGSGSVLIVTTRDVRILDLLKVDYVCKMKEMDQNESLQLFSWHAFREASPKEDFSELSRNVVAYCGGLPLALEVLGSYLNERTRREWESVLSKLKRIPNDQVQEKLRISYDGLRDDMEKDIFLDICCFFIGKDRAYVTEILNGCGFYADIGITVLIERSLVKVDQNNKLQMHNLLRDMGREIVRRSSIKEPEKRSRLWFHEDVHDILTKNTGTNTVEGLVLKLQQAGRVRFSTKAFKEMKKMRLLQLDFVDLNGEYGYLPKQLRWVCWKGFTFNYIPDDFYQGDIVVIDLKYSNIRQVWKETKLLEKLKILNLSHSRYLKNTPEFSKLPNLEKLIMKDCPSLSEVHQSIGDLRNLILINFKDCTSLSSLPRKIYQLKSLKTLILSGCSKIDKLEEDIVQMESLTTLVAKDTAIKEMPFSIVRSKSIGYISLCGYEGLARNVFPSLIWSWMSPINTMNPMSSIPSFGSISSSLAFMEVQNNNLGVLSPMINDLSKLRSVWVQCNTEFQVSQALQSILEDTYFDAKVYDLSTTSIASSSQMLEHSLRFLFIGVGSYYQVLDSLSKSVLEGLTINGSSDCSLPSDNFPGWLTHTGEGHSVLFKVPDIKDWFMKGMILCVVYSSTTENLADDCLISVLFVNYTKCSIQIYKRHTAISFNDEDWQGIKSNLGHDDIVEICVVFGNGLTIKKTIVYLIYDK